MITRILKGTLTGIGLLAGVGCADLGSYAQGPAYVDSSFVLRAAPDERGNGNRGNSQRNNPQGDNPQRNDGGNGAGADLGVHINIGFDEVRRLAVDNQLTGYAALPPGIRKNLARGKPLPPGIAKRAVPAAMLVQLPVIDGHEWQVSGTDLVLIALGTLVVVEILEGVFE
jgi:hypothetical protein